MARISARRAPDGEPETRRRDALTASSLRQRLESGAPMVAVELRPPRAGLAAAQSLESWIDTYHSVRRLAERDTLVFFTDSAVGQGEEQSLFHLDANLGPSAKRERLVPFLTCKHTLDYCLRFAQRAASQRYPGLVVLGGDRFDAVARCVPHAYELRRLIRAKVPGLMLGAWVNPHRDPQQQVDFLLRLEGPADFYLSQIVSHYQLDAVERFLEQAAERGLSLPGIFGVFFYRSARPDSLRELGRYFPVPAAAVAADWAGGIRGEEICARTVRGLRGLGITRVYLSNLGSRATEARLDRILQLVDGAEP